MFHPRGKVLEKEQSFRRPSSSLLEKKKWTIRQPIKPKEMLLFKEMFKEMLSFKEIFKEMLSAQRNALGKRNAQRNV